MESDFGGKLERVALGYHVSLELVSRSGTRETLEFDLVPDDQADYQAGFLGDSAPLAQAILGESAGTLIPYFTEDFQAIEIISIAPATRKTKSGTATRRRENIQEAKNQIEFRDAVLFASSTDTKWGDYDADGLDYYKWKSQAQNNTDRNDKEADRPE